MLRKPSIFWLTFIILLLFGCFEEAADLKKPKEYNSNQIFFKYPKNWEISVDTSTNTFHNLFLETQGEAMVIYQSYPSDMAEDLNTFSKSFSEGAQTENPIGEISQSELKIIPKKSGFEGVEETFEVSILGVSVPHKRIFLSKMIADRQVFLIYQVAIEDHPKTYPGLNLIRDTFKESEES